VVRRHSYRENTPLAFRRAPNNSLISRRLRHQHQQSCHEPPLWVS